VSRYAYEYGRGRHKGKRRIYTEPLYTIVEIASKYDIDLHQLIESIITAWKNQTDQCGVLTITCRGVKHDDTAMILVTDHETVVSQFPIKTQVLGNPYEFHNHLQYLPVQEIRERYAPKETVWQKIGQLKNKMKRVDLKAKIIEIFPVRRVMTRFGEWANFTNVTIADDTGSIQLSLWNNQLQNHNVGDPIEITNGHVAQYQGQLQLRLGRKGTIT
jgi:replication factor A1